MKNYDWIVVGAGITGAAASYELVQQGFKVLLIEQYLQPQGATRYSYGGLAYWAGTSPLTRQLCQEGRDRYQILSQELDGETQFRELDLLLTVASEQNPQSLATTYPNFSTPPQLLTIEEACQLEPLLNPEAISGAFRVPHGHISPEKTNAAYIKAFKRLGGEIKFAQVMGFIQTNTRITGVQTTAGNEQSAEILVCAGGLSRQLLQSAGITVPIYFTHTEVLETPPVDIKLNTLIMSAGMERFQLEAKATDPKLEHLWDEPHHEILPFIIDRSAIQFLDNRIRIGQPSRILTHPQATINPADSEALIRREVGNLLPALEQLPAQWFHCLVAFTHDSLPLVGAIPNYQGLSIFSGFSNPLLFIPPMAQHFAQVAIGKTDPIVEQCSPNRFIET